jgi:homoserine kinase
MSRRFTITVPATSANIGPGFDVCGVSLSLALTLDVHVGDTSAPPGLTLAYTGEGADEVPLDPYKNLLTRIALYVLRCHGVRTFPAHTSIRVANAIPFGRGLGSSGAAVVAGVLLGDALGALQLSRARMLDFALMVERHPDNVAAALEGGFVGAYLRELPPAALAAAQVPLAEVLPEFPPDAGPEWGLDPPVPPTGIGHCVRFAWAPEIKAVAIIPRFELSTATAREVLPTQYSRQDLVRAILSLSLYPTPTHVPARRSSTSSVSPCSPPRSASPHRTPS